MSLRSRTLLLITITLSAAIWCNAQEVVRQFTVEDGLPSTEVYFIHQDVKGYMWFCTDRGVSRYNGYEFENFTTRDGLSYNTNFKIFEDEKQNLWFTGFDGSLSKWDVREKVFTPFIHNTALQDVLGSYNWVYSMDFSGDTMVLFPHSKGQKITTVNQSGRYSKPVKINMDEDGEPNSNLYRLRQGAPHFEKYCFLRIGNVPWQQKYPGLNHIIDTLQNSYRVLEVYAFGSSLAICTHVGVWIYDAETYALTNHLFPDIEVSSILKDQENNLWLTTINKGVFVLTLNEVENHETSNFLEEGEGLTRVGSVGSRVMVGTNRGRLFDLPSGKHLNAHLQSLSDIHSIDYVDGRLYASYGQELRPNQVIQQKNASVADKRFYRFIPLNDSVLFFSTAMRFGLYHNVNGELVDEDGRITDAIKLPRGDVFLSEKSTLYRLEAPQKGVRDKLQLEKLVSLDRATIRDIEYLNDSLILLGTTGSGIVITRFGKEVIGYVDGRSGLPSQMVNAVKIDHKNKRIWCATNRGVSIIDYTFSHKAFKTTGVTNLNREQGLSSNFIKDLTIADSLVWTITARYASSIPRNFVLARVQPPQIDIERVSFSGREVQNHESLPFKSNDMKVSFNAFSLHKPLDGKFYKYTIKANDGTFLIEDSTNERALTFMNLDAGDYLFSVAARSENSNWGEPAVLNFQIKPYFFNRLSVRVIGLSFIALLITFLVRRRLNNLKKENETRLQVKSLQVQNSRLELETLRGQMNPHFVFNALKSIQKLVMTHENNKANSLLTRFSKLMRSSLEYSRVDFIEVLKEKEFLTNYLEVELQRTPGKFIYEIQVKEGVSDDMQIPSLLIQPICENAVKHAFVSRTGQLTITLAKVSSGVLEVNIIDDGAGFYNATPRDESTQNSLGLNIVKSRLGLLRMQGYETAIEIKPLHQPTMAGTIVKLKIPYK